MSTQPARLIYPVSFLHSIIENLEQEIDGALEAYRVPEAVKEGIHEAVFFEMLLAQSNHPDEWMGDGAEEILGDIAERYNLELDGCAKDAAWLTKDIYDLRMAKVHENAKEDNGGAQA